VNPLNGKEVQAPLDKDTVLLAYHTGSEWNGLFVVTQGAILGFSLDIPERGRLLVESL